MLVDSGSLSRAARHLDVALERVDAARSVRVSLLGGRAGAKDASHRWLAEAREQVQYASVELGSAGSSAGVGDARRAIDRLGVGIDDVRGVRNVLEARRGEAFRAAVEGARGWVGALEVLGDGAVAVERGAMREWVRQAVNGAGDPVRLRAARSLVDDPAVAKQLGDAAPYVGGIEPSTPQSIQLARVALDEGAAVAARGRQSPGLAENPAAMKRLFREEVEAIVAKSDDQITREDLRRLALINGLDSSTSLDLPFIRNSSLLTLGDGRRLPLNDVMVGDQIDSLRMWSERGRLVADPAVTKQSLRAEFDAIITKPYEDITRLDMRRLALIEGLEGSKRPTLPLDLNYSLTSLYRHRRLPTNFGAPRDEIANHRRYTDAALDSVRQRLAAGEPLDAPTMAALFRGGNEVLRRVGLSPSDELLGQSLRTLTERGKTERRDMESNLRGVRGLIDAIDVEDPVARGIRDDMIKLLDRNVERVAHRGSGDGYAGHPDYAELGRVASQGELLLALRGQAAKEGAAVGAAAPTTTNPGLAAVVAKEEMLTW